MLYHFAKININQTQLNERGKIGAKIFSYNTDIVIFVLGFFLLWLTLYVTVASASEVTT